MTNPVTSLSYSNIQLKSFVVFAIWIFLTANKTKQFKLNDIEFCLQLVWTNFCLFFVSRGIFFYIKTFQFQSYPLRSHLHLKTNEIVF